MTSELFHWYANQVAELDKMVSKLVFESYGVEKYHESHVGSVTYTVRLIRHRVPEQNEMNVGVPPHTDKNFITILQQNEADGLEVQLKNGSWIPIDFPPSSVIIMAGDVFSVRYFLFLSLNVQAWIILNLISYNIAIL
mgnify:CR=1 FL=1